MADNLEHRWHELRFGILRSIRYHARRRRFFERYHTVTAALSVLLGSATILLLLRRTDPMLPALAAGLVTVLATFDLVVGTVRLAREHAELGRRFIELEKALTTAEPDDQVLKQLTARRLDIEADEPPVLHILNTICHNELARALGYGPEHLIHLRWYQRLLAHIFDIQEHRLPTHV